MSDFKIKNIVGAGGDFLYQDIVIENGRLQLAEGIDEIKNRVTAGLSVYVGENWNKPEYGTDYHNNVFGRSSDDTVAIDELKAQILKTRGVTGIDTFEITEPDSERGATLSAQVKTTQGNINVTTPIIM